MLKNPLQLLTGPRIAVGLLSLGGILIVIGVAGALGWSIAAIVGGVELSVGALLMPGVFEDSE